MFVSSSWFLVAGLIAVAVAPRVEQAAPGLGPWKYLAGFAFAVLLYASVLLHEASHAYMARHYGFAVNSITLHFLGGVTAIETEARNARQEFWIAVVGPLTSLAVGVAALGLWLLEPTGLALVAIEGLAAANLLVGLLNLVPGLPLDGGRVLKAAVWQVSGDAARGTVVAGWAGRIAALGVLGWPVLVEQVWGSSPSAIDFLLSFVVALFLWTGASSALLSARVRSRLPGLVARSLARRAVLVAQDAPLAEAVRQAQQAHAGGIVTVTSTGEPVGVVNESALLAVPEDRRAWVPVSSVTRTLTPGMTLPVELRGEELVRAMHRSPATEYVLQELDGQVFGVLSTQDVDTAFAEAQRRGH